MKMSDKSYTGETLETLPEKCVWSKADASIFYCAVPENIPADNIYPDVWYQGLMSFSDAIWKVNIKTGEEKENQKENQKAKEHDKDRRKSE